MGGGHIIGEACHYIDPCTFLANSKVVSVCINAKGTDPQEKSFVLYNWRELRPFGVSSFKKMKSKQDKGHKAQFELLVKQVKEGGDPLVPFHETVNTTKASFAAIESLKAGSWIAVK